MNIDWTQAATIGAEPPPDLRRSDFEWVITTRTVNGNYLEDIIAAVLAALKDGVDGVFPPNPEGYRLAKSRISGQIFNYQETINMIYLFEPIINHLFPSETLSEEEILSIWMLAANREQA